MTNLLTEIAIQMKGSLSFLLGLGGLFSMTRSALSAQIGLPGLTESEESSRPSLKNAVDSLRLTLWIFSGCLAILFLMALFLYFVPLSSVDAEELSKGVACLSPAQQWAVGGVVVIAVSFVCIDTFLSIKKQALKDLIARHRVK